MAAASNMLDVPNFFWDSEPTLHPLYFGVREYLEIKPRIQVLNERCRVFLDLAEILSDSIADNKMSSKSCPVVVSLFQGPSNHQLLTEYPIELGLTYIIIILILISIFVTCSEVFLRFGILSARGPGPRLKHDVLPFPPAPNSSLPVLGYGEL